MVNISILSLDASFRDKMSKMVSDETILQVVFNEASYIKFFSKKYIAKTDILILDDQSEKINIYTLIKKIKASKKNILILLAINTLVDTEWPALLSCGIDGLVYKNAKKSVFYDHILTIHENGASIDVGLVKSLLSYYGSKSVVKETIRLNNTTYRVLALLSEGKSYEEISESMAMSLDGIRYHIKVLYKKLGVNNKGSAISKFLKGQVVIES